MKLTNKKEEIISAASLRVGVEHLKYASPKPIIL